MNLPGGRGANRQNSATTASSATLFGTTHWSVVLAADTSGNPDAAAALERLCSTYWPPLYAYLRRAGRSPIEAEDLTQGFFAHFLEKDIPARANPQRGRFRNFLLTCLQHHCVDAQAHQNAQKRGGRVLILSLNRDEVERRYLEEAVDHLTPERAFEKRWATTLLELVLHRLGDEFARSGQRGFFEQLKGYIWGNEGTTPVREIATQFGIGESAVRVTVHRLRHRFREIMRTEIAHTVADFEDIDEEIRHLAEVLRQP